MEGRGHKLGSYLKIDLFVLLMDAFHAWLIQLLWNWVVPSITGFKAVLYWQAVVLLVICNFIGASNRNYIPTKE